MTAEWMHPQRVFPCPVCDNLVEPKLAVHYVKCHGGQAQGPLVSVCPDCGGRLFPLRGEIETTRKDAA